jgi:GTP-binding protein Era
MVNMPFRCGYVAIAGPPNVGKSTLLNSFLGKKVSIVSPKPQTTRVSIKGIKTTAGYQIVFVDTPGYHSGGARIDRQLAHEAGGAVQSVDLICLLADLGKNKLSDFYLLLEKIAGGNAPVILALSKADIYGRKELLAAADRYSDFANFLHIIPISAHKGMNIEKLEQLIADALPVAPALFSSEELTTQTELFITAEFIREQVFNLLHQEIPYSIIVETDYFENEEKSIHIEASIIIAKEKHKPIVLGKGGQMLKEIGVRARKELMAHFGKKVHLQLWVKVHGNG